MLHLILVRFGDYYAARMDGRSREGDEGWKMEDGRWRLEDGGWKMEN